MADRIEGLDCMAVSDGEVRGQRVVMDVDWLPWLLMMGLTNVHKHKLPFLHAL